MRYLFLFLVVLLFAACKKKQENCTVLCDHHGVTVIFTGYTLQDIDTIYFRSYNRNGLFDSLIKDTLISNTDSLNFPGTTIKSLCPVFINSELDYEFVIPATAQTFKVASNYTVIVDNILCQRSRPCVVPWQGATITGGNYSDYGTGPGDQYIILKK